MRDRDHEDFRRFVSPLLPARVRAFGEPDRIQKASGTELIADDGRRVLDFLAGWGTQPFGHRPAAVEARLREFLDGQEPALYTSGVSPFAGRLARELCRRSGLDRVFFASGGTEAVEAALKLARAATGRQRILCLEGAYHGCTMGSLALMAEGPFRAPFGPHLPSVEALPFGDVATLRAALERAPDVAAVVVEPVQVEGGVRPAGEGYLAALGEEADRRGFVLVADEIQTGLGRMGRFLASEAWPRRPDAVVLGKALGGGMLPISCLLSAARLFDRAYGTPETAEIHYSTFSGNSLACVAALATLEALDAPLLARIAEARLAERLAAALQGRRAVKAVRGAGLLVGIELAGEKPSSLGLWLCRRLLRAGYYTGLCAHDPSTVRVHPPLTTSDPEIDAFVELVARETQLLEQSPPRDP
ncbi:MAG TPA: aspartate aminotransferase family protein [Myxococcaceae bacterium]